MTNKRNRVPLEQPPIEIIRGAQIKAEYLTQEVPLFRDNPLIEALPPTLTPPITCFNYRPIQVGI
jgi:hypothetical protein